MVYGWFMSKRLSRKPSDVLTRNGYNVRTIRANLVRVFESATDDNIADGLEWYGEANSFARDLAQATNLDVVTVAAVIAAMSPRTRWEANKAAAQQFLKDGTRYPGLLVSNYERAKFVLNAGPENALASLQWIGGDESAPKIASFARNILGDTDRVTIDVWATRGALMSPRAKEVNLDNMLRRAGMYEAIAAQYVWLAHRMGITAPQAQAIVWVALTGKAASERRTMQDVDAPVW